MAKKKRIAKSEVKAMRSTPSGASGFGSRKWSGAKKTKRIKKAVVKK